MTLVEEARDMASRRTSKEIEKLTNGRERTDIEHLAYMFALQDEIEARIASKKTKAAEEETEYDIGREKAEAFYNSAKEVLRAEKKRHCIAEEGFAEEKVRHSVERKRHAKAVAQFQKDAEPWRKIVRAEKEAERIFQANQDAEFDASLEEQKTKQIEEENKT